VVIIKKVRKWLMGNKYVYVLSDYISFLNNSE